jgi:hypothetical protein
MSWGERSCVYYGDCSYNPHILLCNVDCPHYLHDKETEPDSSSNGVDTDG